MSLIHYEINLILTWSANCVIINLTGEDNAKLLTNNHLKSGIKTTIKTINCNKYQSKIAIERKKEYLDCSVKPTFQGLHRLFVLSFEDNAVGTGRTRYCLTKVEIKDYKYYDQWTMNELFPWAIKNWFKNIW